MVAINKGWKDYKKTGGWMYSCENTQCKTKRTILYDSILSYSNCPLEDFATLVFFYATTNHRVCTPTCNVYFDFPWEVFSQFITEYVCINIKLNMYCNTTHNK